MLVSLCEITPSVGPDEMIAALVPPRHFSEATLLSYRPDGAYPSQAAAVERVTAFLARRGARGWSLRRRPIGGGLYLDGGFGVGKTHLLAAAWHAFAGEKVYGTFIEFTAIVGALGYRDAADRLRGVGLVCIDEFELDDPGDTLIMSRLLGELVSAGCAVVATSNTPPDALGDGRFAAADFQREIQSLASVFEVVRIDGADYRTRHTQVFHQPRSEQEFADLVERWDSAGAVVAVDDFRRAMAHLGTLHPVRFEKLAAGIDAVAWRDASPLSSHTDGLRLVAFIDRLYDAGVSVVVSGCPLSELFSEQMRDSGYAKKYLRALSRLAALSQRGVAVAGMGADSQQSRGEHPTEETSC